MIDLTPLDVRNKKGDFAKVLRGYDAGEVDTFLDLVAERLEELVRENMTLRERSDRLLEQVSSQEGREKAVQEALVTAQELREEVQSQAQRQADLIRKEAEGEARRIVLEAEREVKERREALEELERKRLRFLRAFRSLLERELDVVEVEEGRQPLEDIEVELELGGGRRAAGPPTPEVPEGSEEPRPEPPAEPEDEDGEYPPLDAPVHELAGMPSSAGPLDGSGSPGRDDVPADDLPAGDLPADEPGEEEPGPEEPEEGPEEEPGDDLWLSSILQDDERGESGQ